MVHPPYVHPQLRFSVSVRELPVDHPEAVQNQGEIGEEMD